MDRSLTGELAALGAAALWALSSVVYALLGQNIPPLKLNFLKGIVAILFIGLTLVIEQEVLPSLKVTSLIILLLSGAIGIGIGDTAYLAALNHLGARRTLLMETLAPPITSTLAFLFLQETLNLKAWCGILLTLVGIVWVITERAATTVINKANFHQGIIWGIIAALSQAIGVVLSRFALLESGISPLWSTLYRLVAGALILMPLLFLSSQSTVNNNPLSWSWRLIGVISLTAFGSTYLGIWLQQISLKYAPAGIAQTLLATSPLFVLPLAAFMGEKISFRAILGIVIAIAGISALF